MLGPDVTMALDPLASNKAQADPYCVATHGNFTEKASLDLDPVCIIDLKQKLREVDMGVLMVACPVTGKEFSTGISTDEETYSILPNIATKATCPYCGQVHRWWPKEGRLLEVVDPGPPNLRRATHGLDLPHGMASTAARKAAGADRTLHSDPSEQASGRPAVDSRDQA